MNLVLLVMSVCLVGHLDRCEKRQIQVSSPSLGACLRKSPIYIAQWTGENPKWVVQRWHCAWPGAEGQRT